MISSPAIHVKCGHFSTLSRPYRALREGLGSALAITTILAAIQKRFAKLCRASVSATLNNQSVTVAHGTGNFVLGGIDDLILGKPDWARLMSELGAPHLLLAHNPDHFYDAAGHGVTLVVSGHTHGGQIRFASWAAHHRQSRFCLDEGVYSFQSSLLVVTRGLGSILLPWRWGADPEAVMIEIVSAK